MKQENHITSPTGRHSFLEDVLWIGAVALVYFAAARLSLQLIFQPEGIAAIWPQEGIFLSALLLTRQNLRPWLAGALFLTDLSTELLAGTPLPLSFCYAFALTGSAVLSTWLLLRFVGKKITFGKVREICCFLILAVGFSNMLMAVVAATASTLLSGSIFIQSWQWWAASNGVGNLLVTPFILSMASLTSTKLKSWHWKNILEGISLFTTLALVNYFLFYHFSTQTHLPVLLAYTTIPFLLWAALRFGVRGTSFAVLILATIAIYHAVNGQATSASSLLGDLIDIQLLLAIMAAASIFLAAVVTERKRAEDNLRFQSNILNSLAVGINLVRLSDRTLVFTNPAFDRMFGYEAGELIGKHMSIVSAPGEQSPEALANTVMAELAQTGVWSGQVQNIRKNEVIFWCRVHVTAFDHPRFGRVWVCMHEDITERKQIETALLESQAKFRAIIEATPVPLAVSDEQGNIIFLNKAFVQTIGYTTDDIPTLADWWPRAYPDPQYRQRVAESWQSHLEEAKCNNRPFSPLELNIQCKGGSVRTFMVGTASLENHFDRTHLVILHDITERKLAERELLVAAVSFESQESLMITDASSVILRVNQAFTGITGYTAEEALGQTPRLLHSGRHNTDFYRAMWESLHRTGAWQGEIWNRRRNGEIYPAWLTISAVKGGDGAITHYVGSHLDITERKAAEEKIHLLAFYDPLTSLPNRRLLFDRLKLALSSSTRSGREGALLFIDLDNFKTLNDTLGHDTGDLLLQQVAHRLALCVREGDTVARLGGDEFVVILEDLSEHPLEAAAQTESIGEKIIATLNQPYQLAQHEYRSTPSIGATLFSGHERGVDELFKQSDIAMYQAKKAGRNTLRFFDPQMQDTINARAALENELRKAITNRQFQLYYQIQMDYLRRPLGAEALIRWAHPERGLVFPDQFIALAEETGLILPIGQWVLETACAQLKAWQQDTPTRELVLAVNVSARQFHQADFVAQVQAVVQRHAINPMLLKLELTESMLLENIEDAIATMNALKEFGVQFSLDDFGSGYSSLQYLKRLPLDQLKIDQSFIRDIAIDSGDKAVVLAIIAMAQSMNLDVIAEGVEMNEQRQLLLSNGCTHYQGYLFGKPVPIGQFDALLKQG